MVSLLPAALNHRWQRSLAITSTSTSWRTVGTVDTPETQKIASHVTLRTKISSPVGQQSGEQIELNQGITGGIVQGKSRRVRISIIANTEHTLPKQNTLADIISRRHGLLS